MDPGRGIQTKEIAPEIIKAGGHPDIRVSPLIWKEEEHDCL